MKRLQSVPTETDIREAHLTIAPLIHRTPVLTSSGLNEKFKCQLFFKAENFQKVGAFKMRGASCAVAALSDSERARGIATHSSGNHAQAVALTARMHQIPAHIVMPENAPTIKRAAVTSYGATIYTSGSGIKDRENMMEEVLEHTGATFIHPYNDYNIIAGQATAAVELLEAVPGRWSDEWYRPYGSLSKEQYLDLWYRTYPGQRCLSLFL